MGGFLFLILQIRGDYLKKDFIYLWHYFIQKYIPWHSLKEYENTYFMSASQWVRKHKKLPDFFIYQIFAYFVHKIRAPPPSIAELQSRWKEKNIKVKNFFKTSIISTKSVLLVVKGRIRHFLLRLLCRGEVIPFGTDQTGKGHCTEKIL